ncbi:hypothetical protein O3G_MSEX001599 [Manduca sexta]|uniref:Suppressor of white apricot N-terminal domain-containing protein n=1 Tax=Manduca sexta TaxID=7130 RepID=A0A922CCQ2_MANSE|nr:hypothetical protein O3G_MSEX001599 [Manduca sexta]
MWHEARKQERMIRGMIVDYRRRAERRKDFYEKIKAEPTQFLQLHGRPCKIHLDPAIAAAGEGPAIMMPWQGDSSNMIDRFDVRAHLDFIPEVKNPDIPPEELSPEERQCNYERYRILAQNVFLGISEDKFLQQLAIEEQFGVTIEEKELQKEKLHEKKSGGAAIGYNYNDPGSQPSCSTGPEVKKADNKDSDDESDLEIIDVDLSIDVNKMEASQAHELNAVGPQFGMAGCDLFSFLTGDADDAEHQKQLLREEKEKAMFSGRKSRRERRAHSRSASPDAPDPAPRIQFITSFGGDDDEVKPPPQPKQLYSDKLKQNLKKVDLYSEIARKQLVRSPKVTTKLTRPMGPHRPGSRPKSYSKSRSRSLSRSRSRSKSRSKCKLRSRSPSRRKSVSKSRSYSKSRSSSRSRSRSYSPYRRSRSRSRSRHRPYRRRSRSPVNHGSSYGKRNKSRSISYDSKPAPRYYGRRKEDKSSSELSLDSDSSDSPDEGKNKSAVGNKLNSNQSQLRSGTGSKGASRETLSLKEKLRRKMQAQLSRQLRADKRAEAERLERESRRQARRDEEMRELAIKLRRKQREMRHQQNRRSSEDDSDGSHSRSSSKESNPQEKKEKSRSKSRTPPEKKPPVWANNREIVPHRPKPETSDAYQKRPRNSDNSEYYDREERPQGYGRYDKYQNRDYGQRYYDHNRYENYHYDDRWEQDGYNRRPYERGYRPGPRQGMDYGDGHSRWPNLTVDNRETNPRSKNKVKLVDY